MFQSYQFSTSYIPLLGHKIDAVPWDSNPLLSRVLYTKRQILFVKACALLATIWLLGDANPPLYIADSK